MSSRRALTPLARVRLLYQLARLALRKYGVRDAQLAILQDERETLFRVRGRLEGGTRGGSGSRPERFVLRLDQSGYSDPDHVLSRFEWMQAIRRDAGLVVPEPVRSSSGEYLVRLVVDEKYTLAAAAKAVGVSVQSLRAWQKKFAPPLDPCGENATLDELREENKRLRRQLRRAELEREILKKATAYFAKESL